MDERGYRSPTHTSSSPLIMWYGNSLRPRDSTAHSGHRLAARRSHPTYSDIVEATNATVRVFEAQGTPICAVGGLACKLLGNPRTPNDADLLLLDTISSQEQIKRVLVNANSQFYLVPAIDPLATYKVLWYRTTADVRVKVDLLQPGIMSIPNISSGEIEYKNTGRDSTYGTYGGTQSRIPIAPFGLILLLKLQAWEQHRDSPEYRFQQKQHIDARDIDVLLPLAVAARVKFDSLPDEFVQEARKRVVSYARIYPQSKQSWQQLGFKVVEQPARTTTASYARTSTSRYSRPQVSSTNDNELAGIFSRLRVSSTATSRVTRPQDSWLFDYD
ncbi:hypothetical protein FRC10_006364 [Ceratobasidium sp. 414]|nr:hypothetical protein FRC10_006364 [Ceratobasidium sp. 414]